jgi:hypothetical protein
MTTDLDLQQLDEALNDFPDKYTKAHIAKYRAEIPFRNLDEMKKAMFASIQSQIEESYEDKLSEAKLERLALASDRWKQYITGYNKARALFLSADSRVKCLEAELDCMRSRNALYKKEMNFI